MLETISGDDRLLVISPHLDDAVLSAGGLIDRVVKAGGKALAGTIFTADPPAGGELSPLVQELHAWWNLGDNPYAPRRQEDIAALEFLGADYLHGGLYDCIYRRGPDGRALYPTRQAVFSPPVHDDGAPADLAGLLAAWVARFAPTVILCPMTVGRHVDHVVTLAAVRQLAPGWDAPVYLYEDMPYAAGFFPPDYPDSVAAARQRAIWQASDFVDVDVDFANKLAAVNLYASQIAEIFPGRDAGTELRSYMGARQQGACSERFWRLDNQDGHQP